MLKWSQVLRRNGNSHTGNGTLNLPRTTFAMRANLPQREPEILRYWEEIALDVRLRERNAGRQQFVLHDGPPFSNGDIHLGHALNKILKDVVVKVHAMRGKDAVLVPGWDTHGLPTEISAIRTFAIDRGAIPPLELRRRCADSARRWLQQQRRQFQRLGVRATWEQPYLTMDPAYEAAVLESFRRLVERGLIYHGQKPVYWCTTCETALAGAEVEYREHEAPSVYVAFPVETLPDTLFSGVDRARMSAAVWTTTPWTLPANTAVAVNPALTYALVTDETDEEGFTYLVTRSLVESFARATAMEQPRVLFEMSARALDGATFRHPFLSRIVPLVFTDYVTADAGTGLVPIAPGLGQEDFITGISYGLPVVQPVGPSGVYGVEAGPFAGKTIYEGQDAILARMDTDGTLLAHDTILHQYPHCWRCLEPVIMRVTPQWFFAVRQLADRVPDVIERVRWLPAWGRARMAAMLHDYPDWCISRQRAWGIPIPVFHCLTCDTPLLSPAVIAHVTAIVREHGSDAWFRLPERELLPADTTCPRCGAMDFRKETDIFDVWFDSACSQFAVLESRDELSWPADLVLEGHDQFRGWFQALLLVALGAGRDEAPYRTVLAHGFILDETGEKQSKSLGNIIDPQAVTTRYGADILRLWVASIDTRTDVAMSAKTFTSVMETYRRLRNTARFLLGNLYDFTPIPACPVMELPEIDRWMLHRLREVVICVTQAYDQYAFHRAIQVLNEFCANDLSAFYFDVLKDRLYVSHPDDPGRRAAQTVFHHLLLALARLLAPVLSFTAEDIWLHLPSALRDAPSVLLAGWAQAPDAWRNDALAACWARLLGIRAEVTTALVTTQTSGKNVQALASKITLYSAGETKALLESVVSDLATFLIVSAVSLAPLDSAPADAYHGSVPELAIGVAPAPGEQCARCRWWRPVGTHPGYPALCARCAGIEESMISLKRSTG